jgi:hypothetical protein
VPSRVRSIRFRNPGIISCSTLQQIWSQYNYSPFPPQFGSLCFASNIQRFRQVPNGFHPNLQQYRQYLQHGSALPIQPRVCRQLPLDLVMPILTLLFFFSMTPSQS